MSEQFIVDNLKLSIAGMQSRIKTLEKDLLSGDYLNRAEIVTKIEFLQTNIVKLRRILQDLEPRK